MNPKYSVVIPILNEEESIEELLTQIDDAFKKLKEAYEILFVDDGSTDSTLEILKKHAQKSKFIRIYSFRRNLGKSTALTLAFQKVKGEFVLTMDADLQDDLTNLPEMIKAQKEGDYDLISGWRKNRKDSLLKIINSKFFNNFIIPMLFQVNFKDMNSGLKLYRTELAREIKIYGGMHRFIPILATEMGFRVKEEIITHKERKYGVSKYKSTKIFTDIPDLMTMYFLVKYTKRPLHFFSKLGGILLGAGTLILLYLILVKIMGQSISTRPLLTFGVLFEIAGIQTIFTGLLADLIVNFNRVYNEEDLPIKYKS